MARRGSFTRACTLLAAVAFFLTQSAVALANPNGPGTDCNTNGIPVEYEPIRNVTQSAFYATIQSAIDQAASGDEIAVGPGTYVERINLLGKAIILRSTDGPGTTMIDGDAAGSVITCTSGEGSDTVIEGFTVTDGTGTLTSGFTYGGGLYAVNSNPTIRDCEFTGNAADHGAGMFGNNSRSTLADCTFDGNSAGSGGGLSSRFGRLSVVRCVFSANTASREGGGMATFEDNSRLRNCMFAGNTAAGGGVGGGVYLFGGTSQCINCVFSGNSATYSGGGVHNERAAATFTNCSFSGNSADVGGAVCDYGGLTTLLNCILWGNTALILGPDVYNHYPDFPMTVAYTSSQYLPDGGGNFRNDPRFVDPDGPDDVIGTPDDNLRLSAGSPCIDRGLPHVVPDVRRYPDMDGNLRIVDDPVGINHGADPVDLGAYEYGSTPFVLCTADLDDDGDVDLTDFLLFQLQFGGPN